MTTIGERIRSLRKSKELSMNELEDLIGASRGSVNKWEKGSIPGGNSLMALAAYFGVSTDWILTGEHPALLHGSAAEAPVFVIRERESGAQELLVESLMHKLKQLPEEKLELLHALAEDFLKLQRLESSSQKKPK